MIEPLIEIQTFLLDQFKEKHFYYPREIFKKINSKNLIIGILGSRGIGKTTYLLKRVLDENQHGNHALYVSADHVFFLTARLIDVVDTLYKTTDIRLLCIDEIHKYPNWAQEIKNIVDSYPKFRILFSGSSAIDILRSKYDLSRRVTLYELHGFSFREYLEFIHKKSLPLLTFSQVLNEHQSIVQSIASPTILKYFKEYLRVGYYPYFKTLINEIEKFQTIENITQKIIYEDIATLFSLKTPTLLTIEKLYKYILQALPGELSVYKLANALSKDFESVSEYIELLKQAGLIHSLYPHKVGKAFLRNPVKILPENSNMLYAHFIPQLQDTMLGKSRETFAINQLQNAQCKVYYSEIGDMKVEDAIFEIGGKNKTTQQIKNQKNAYVLADDLIIGAKNTIPLYLLGLLY